MPAWFALGLALLTAPWGNESWVLRGGRVLAPEGGGWVETDVRVAGGRIQELGPDLEPAAGEREVELAGAYVIPGLIDLHSHLLLHPYDEASWNDQVLRESLELRTVRGVAALAATLRGGFTTLRDLGTEGAGFADVALRDAVRLGIVDGPRIFASTRALVASGCYGPSGFDPRWEVPKGAQEADGPTQVRRAVRQQIAAGADWIKVYADYRRQPGDPATPTFTVEELRAAVDEARSAGLPVAAHATVDEAIRRAVVAGCATIEHGSHASLETLRLLEREGVVLCPTLAAAEAMARYGGWSEGSPEPPRIEAARALIRNALEAGVQIACGSDVGVFAHGESVRELELLVAYGLTPAQALRAATRTAADVLGRPDLGRISPGASADLVVLAADPLVAIENLRSVRQVFVRGARVVDRP